MRFICVLALGLVPLAGCTGDGGAAGSAGASPDGGTGGASGIGGAGGGSTGLCEPTEDSCRTTPSTPHAPCCKQEVPDQANACTGTESVRSPTTCTATGDRIACRLTTMELEGDCNVGYDLDDCDGESCVPGRLTP